MRVPDTTGAPRRAPRNLIRCLRRRRLAVHSARARRLPANSTARICNNTRALTREFDNLLEGNRDAGIPSAQPRAGGVWIPSTSVRIWHSSAPSAAASATAVVSEPPRPNAVISPSASTPWNPPPPEHRRCRYRSDGRSQLLADVCLAEYAGQDTHLIAQMIAANPARARPSPPLYWLFRPRITTYRARVATAQRRPVLPVQPADPFPHPSPTPPRPVYVLALVPQQQPRRPRECAAPRPDVPPNSCITRPIWRSSRGFIRDLFGNVEPASASAASMLAACRRPPEPYQSRHPGCPWMRRATLTRSPALISETASWSRQRPAVPCPHQSVYIGRLHRQASASSRLTARTASAPSTRAAAP